MKRTVLAALILSLSTVAWATGVPGTVPKPNIPPIKRTLPVSSEATANPVVNAGASSQAISGAGAQAGAQIGTVGNSLNVDYPGVAVAPDVIAYPTAPCRVAGGVSAGWFGGAVGFSGSVSEESCVLINKSVHLHNIGQAAASIQIMCLDADTKKALEATGVKCLIKPEPAPEPVKP